MIIRMLLDGLLSLGRPTRPATMRVPWTTTAPQQRHADIQRATVSPFRGRPDLMLVTGAMSAPTAIPPRAVRGRYTTVGRWAA